ncbi:hypothetical protein TraAM80_01467 [Trypanosoma rangeli]|uniref:Uncharacterized protein n=1 Tax=Trypanosoma rangeli TaxID=5698 RepID=A0A3R7MZS1_TRYRA|nr:uncharacterized protein TraAM80_01467 [Trypanosoma rangeli]RNF10542.1 hypothetical protein TraAM80_01467 [Trypanosoma rangeli]|eukprot:RNF10542.1 hypothetical protein TraAM80_01467 [Trypanosoma rangeli]
MVCASRRPYTQIEEQDKTPQTAASMGRAKPATFPQAAEPGHSVQPAVSVKPRSASAIATVDAYGVAPQTANDVKTTRTGLVMADALHSRCVGPPAYSCAVQRTTVIP